MGNFHSISMNKLIEIKLASETHRSRRCSVLNTFTITTIFLIAQLSAFRVSLEENRNHDFQFTRLTSTNRPPNLPNDDMLAGSLSMHRHSKNTEYTVLYT